MMQVVYDSHIRDARLTQTLDDGNLVFRFAEPASMIVQAYRAALVSRRLGDGFDSLRLSVDSGALVFSIVRGFSAAHDPKLCFNLMPLQDLQDLPRFIVERRRKPPAQEFDFVPLQRFDLRVERGNMFGPIIVDELLKPQPFQN